MNAKLWNIFCITFDMYNNNSSNLKVLKELYVAKSSSSTQANKKKFNAMKNNET